MFHNALYRENNNESSCLKPEDLNQIALIITFHCTRLVHIVRVSDSGPLVKSKVCWIELLYAKPEFVLISMIAY